MEDIPDCRGIRCVITERRWGEDPSGVRNVVRECAVLSETSKGEKKLLSLQIALWALEKYLFITGRAQGLCKSGSEMIFLSSIGHGHIEWPCGGEDEDVILRPEIPCIGCCVFLSWEIYVPY